MRLTFSGLYCDDLTIYRHAEIQVIHKQTKDKLTSMIVDINPNDMLKCSSISLSTEALKITSENGELLNIASCALLFKVKIIDKIGQRGYVDHSDSSIDNIIFEYELELFDKDKNGLISNGPHDLNFYCDSNCGLMSIPKQAVWKIKHFVKKSLSLGDDDINKEFLKPAKMKCNLQWSREICLNSDNKAQNSNGTAKRHVFTRSRSTGSIMSRRLTTYKSNENIQCIVYQFIHKNYRQKTEIWDRFKCPWCLLKSTNLYSLLKHLTLCHGHFKFKYVPGASEMRIDVFVNKQESDSSLDPFSRLASRFRGTVPCKRNVSTALILNRPERSRPKLAEFLNLDTNSKRTYYHSMSGLAVKPSEIDINSEDELDPIWLRKNTVKMINEFVDVNDGEKGIMQLWNLFILKHSFVSDSQIPHAVQRFLEYHAEFIINNHLYRNCVIHLTNLFDYGLISAKDHFKAVGVLHKFLIRNRSLLDVFQERVEKQREHTRTCMKTGSTPKVRNNLRSVLRESSAIKRRLRSQSRNESPTQTYRKCTKAIKIDFTPKPVRKLV